MRVFFLSEKNFAKNRLLFHETHLQIAVLFKSRDVVPGSSIKVGGAGGAFLFIMKKKKMDVDLESRGSIDTTRHRYPYCIVWTPLPIIRYLSGGGRATLIFKPSYNSWFIPFIGHMGICTSAGVIRDFAGPYFVSVSHQWYI